MAAKQNPTRQGDLQLASGQRFSCICCGQCCRRWHVALRDSDIERLRELDWQGDPTLQDAEPVMDIGGHPFIAHRDNGDCLYLDPDTQLCKIHSKFGEAAKPLGCRVYPFNLTSTFPGEISATLRMDCPAVQQNHGTPIADNRRQVERFAAEMGLKGGFDAEDTSQLSRKSLQTIAQAAIQLAERTDLSTPLKSQTLVLAVFRLEELGESFLNDTETLIEVMPSFWERTVKMVQERKYRPVGRFSHAIFRQWLASYLRRDEEMVNQSWARRIRRTLALLEIMLKRGSFRALGSEHPAVPLNQLNLFAPSRRRAYPPTAPEEEEAQVWEPYWRFVRSRLETLQFFGVSYYGAPFFMGLRALAMTYPLVLAAARAHAAERDRTGAITLQDVHYAVGAIDHSFGRSRLLGTPVMRSIEVFFSRQRYGCLLAGLQWR